jgi:putative transposase
LPAQVKALLEHCAHARFMWNLCVEQESHYRPGRGRMPGFAGRCRQLTEARAEYPWLAAGSAIVQQQALRDHAQAMANYFAGTHRRPTWRKAGRDEGFRIVHLKPGDIRRVSRHRGQVRVPKVGWIAFRWSRPVPQDVKSCRVTRDVAGRWHVSFAAIPAPTPGPRTGNIVGVDRGVAVAAALSTGELLSAPKLSDRERARLVRLQRRLARAEKGSCRRKHIKLAIAKLRAREIDRRRDWAEKTSTDLARRFEVIRVEDLRIRNMTRSAKGTTDKPGKNVRQKAGLNQSILASAWGLLVRRLEDKAPDRIEKVNPAFTSQRCSACGHVDAKSRESQAAFACTACGYACHADVNAARNIAAGRAVTARGGTPPGEPANRDPQPVLLNVGRRAEIPALHGGEDVNARSLPSCQ